MYRRCLSQVVKPNHSINLAHCFLRWLKTRAAYQNSFENPGQCIFVSEQLPSLIVNSMLLTFDPRQ
jgi:hypothetical protein